MQISTGNRQLGKTHVSLSSNAVVNAQQQLNNTVGWEYGRLYQERGERSRRLEDEQDKERTFGADLSGGILQEQKDSAVDDHNSVLSLDTAGNSNFEAAAVNDS